MKIHKLVKPILSEEIPDGDPYEEGRPFDAALIESNHLRALCNWGENNISIIENPIVVFSENGESLPTALVEIQTKLGVQYGFEGDWVYRTNNGRYRLGNSESFDHYEKG